MSMERGKATRTSAGTTAIIAAPGAGKRLLLRSLEVSIHTFAATGKVIIDDGVTEIFAWDATTSGSAQPPQLKWGKDDAFQWTEALVLNLTTEGAIEVFASAAAELRA